MSPTASNFFARIGLRSLDPVTRTFQKETLMMPISWVSLWISSSLSERDAVGETALLLEPY